MKTVIEMAREAGFDEPDCGLSGSSELDETIYVGEYPVGEAVNKLVALVREDEREKRKIQKIAYDTYMSGMRKQQEPVAWVKAKELAIAKSLSDDGYAKQWSTTLGFKKEDGDIPLYTTPQTIEAAVLAEREACAKVCEEQVKRPADYNGRFGGYGDFYGDKTGKECAAAIRARGEK